MLQLMRWRACNVIVGRSAWDLIRHGRGQARDVRCHSLDILADCSLMWNEVKSEATSQSINDSDHKQGDL